MDIRLGQDAVTLSQNEFNKLDYKVMGLAFDLHNKMGNLWDEKEYQYELALQCEKQGFDTFTEVPITISFDGFSKTYFIDLLVNGSVFELKAVSCISEKHEAQTLNYLFLTNTIHGKIINFRPDSLAWRFVSTTLRHQTRLDYFIDITSWNPASEQARLILKIMENLLSSWGAFLSLNLYKEALCFIIDVPIKTERQRFIPLSTNTLLHVSGLCARKNNLRNNLQKYLNHSSYSELLWLNFNKNKIEFSSLNHSA